MVLKLEVLLVVKRPLAVVEKQEATHGSNTCVVLLGEFPVEAILIVSIMMLTLDHWILSLIMFY